MPRLTKDTSKLEENDKIKKAKVTTKSTTKAVKGTTSKSKVTDKKSASKTAKVKTEPSKKTAIKQKKETQATSKKTTTKATQKSASSKLVKNEIIEYYDLPYRYNKTIVKILAQTPRKLFVYWDISDKDKQDFIHTYGENFFEITKPVLIITNITMNYTFEIDINDFANSWYLNINDSDCKYAIELGRRPIQYNSNINTDYIYISSSNNIESPNDHILFENAQNMVYFRNIKTNITTAKNLTSLSFLTNMGRIYNIYDLYKKIYADEELDNFNNPSSSFMK